MDASERLLKYVNTGGVSFSLETVDNYKILFTVTKIVGSTENTVGGTYDDMDEAINDCIDKLEEMFKTESHLKLVK